jgi:hypothetical protein
VYHSNSHGSSGSDQIVATDALDLRTSALREVVANRAGRDTSAAWNRRPLEQLASQERVNQTFAGPPQAPQTKFKLMKRKRGISFLGRARAQLPNKTWVKVSLAIVGLVYSSLGCRLRCFEETGQFFPKFKATPTRNCVLTSIAQFQKLEAKSSHCG